MIEITNKFIVNRAWLKFAKATVPATASDNQISIMKTTFFAGFRAMVVYATTTERDTIDGFTKDMLSIELEINEYFVNEVFNSQGEGVFAKPH